MSRRRFLHVSTAAVAGALLSACSRTEMENAPRDADEFLSAAGFTAPALDAAVADAPLKGEEAWSAVVTFAGTHDEIDAWVQENFPGGIGSEAYKDDMATAVERLGTGVQKKGDRIASGVEGSVVFLVVVGQGDAPEVHVAVRRTGR